MAHHTIKMIKKLFLTVHGLASDAYSQKKSVLSIICAEARFAICQLRFLYRNEFCFLWDNEIVLKAIKGQHGTTECFYLGFYDYSEMNFLKRFLKSEDGFMDVGANVGTYSLLAASLGADAHAFEPNLAEYKIALELANLNPDLKCRIKYNNVAVGNENKTVRITTNLGSTTNHVAAEYEFGEEYQEVEQIRLDDYRMSNPIRAIKVDVEGYEEFVLNGCNKLLQSDDLKVVIMEDFGGDESNSFNIMRQYGFQRYSYDVKNNSLIRIDTQAGNNAIYLKDFDFVWNRINHK